MKRTVTFFKLFMKRLLRKPSFVLILLMMPLLVLAFRLILKADSTSVNIAVYTHDDNERINEAIDSLCSIKGQMQFYRTESERDLKEAVLTNNAECGFVISKGFYEALLAEKAEDMVTIYRNTKTTLDDLTKEMLFKKIFELVAYDKALNLLKSDGVYDKYGVDSTEFEKKVKEHYEGYLSDGGIFNVIYSDGGKEEVVDTEKELSGEGYLLRPIRGILALFMMIAALAGAVFRAIDEKQGVYKTLGHEERPYINLLTALIPALLSGIAAFISIYIGGVARGQDGSGGIFSGFVIEFIGFAAYIILLTGFANLLRSLIKNEAMLASILPMLTVVSLLGCNIFFNTAAMVNGIEQLRLILPPNYFLEFTDSVSGIMIMMGLGLILCSAGVFTDRRKGI